MFICLFNLRLFLPALV